MVQNHKKSQRSINDTQATFFQDTASILSYAVFKWPFISYVQHLIKNNWPPATSFKLPTLAEGKVRSHNTTHGSKKKFRKEFVAFLVRSIQKL